MELALKMGIFVYISLRITRINWPRKGEEGQFGMKPLYFDTQIILLDIEKRAYSFWRREIDM